MKFNIKKDVLLKGIQSVQSAISSKTALPVLSNILIEAEDDIILTATDLDIGIVSTIQTKPMVKGSVTVPAKKFFDIIKELPDTEISISVKKNNLVNIECQSCVFKIMGLPKDEYPQLPDFKNKEHIALPQDKLKTMIGMTSFAISRDETRYVLNGILFIIRPSFIRMVATDGRRLAVVEDRDVQIPKTGERKFIVPTKAVNELRGLLAEEGDVRMYFGDNQISFDMGKTKLVSRLIEGEFPNYEQVIPKEAREKLMVSRENFLAAAKRVALLTNPDSVAVKIDLAHNKMTLSKNTPYIGEAREELQVDYKGKELSIGFNPDYLIDVLKSMDQDTINFELADSDKPGVIRLGDKYVYVVLPMQTA